MKLSSLHTKRPFDSLLAVGPLEFGHGGPFSTTQDAERKSKREPVEPHRSPSLRPSSALRAVRRLIGVVEPPSARASKNQGLPYGQAGQSLIETALILPLLLLLAFDAINFGYFFYSAVNVASAPREGVEWSIQGPSTPSNNANYAPAGPATDPTSVSSLTYEDMRGALPAFANSRIQVCTQSLGINPSGANTSSQVPNCCVSTSSSGTCTPGGSYTPTPDPEAPVFVLQRVDVVYQITPIIPQFSIPTGGGGRINLSLLPNLAIHRQVSMRGM